MLNGYHLTIELLNSPDGSGILLLGIGISDVEQKIQRTAGGLVKENQMAKLLIKKNSVD